MYCSDTGIWYFPRCPGPRSPVNPPGGPTPPTVPMHPVGQTHLTRRQLIKIPGAGMAGVRRRVDGGTGPGPVPKSCPAAGEL